VNTAIDEIVSPRAAVKLNGQRASYRV
jgi:hypothetical protein